jgi:thiol-disulfide isomerase/thioredoxin
MLPLYSLSQSKYSVNGTMHGSKEEKIVFLKIYGKQEIAVDSMALDKNGSFLFVFPDSQYIGIYRISAGKDNYADIIFNKENISLETEIAGLSVKMKIIESDENKLYYEYINRTAILNDSIELLTISGQKLYDKNPSANFLLLKKIAAKIETFESQKNQLGVKLYSQNPSLFSSKIIKASILPDFKAYMKHKDAATYPNQMAFLKEHFFDNIDFSDTTMLHTEIIFTKCGEYLQNFADHPSVDTYKKAIDFILVRTAVNKNINDYVMNTLINTFDHSDWEDIYIYVLEKYLAQNTCSNDVKIRSLSDKSNAIKTLKPGNKAPSVKTTNIFGKEIILDSIKSPYTLVLFWASWCEYCEKAIPELKNIYTTYKPKGLEILAVSLDSIRQNWLDATNLFNFQWINTCDLKGFESTVIKDYNIWRTPVFFLLDKDKKIIAKPVNTAILKETMEGVK